MTESQEKMNYTTKDERDALGPDGHAIMISDVDCTKLAAAEADMTQIMGRHGLSLAFGPNTLAQRGYEKDQNKCSIVIGVRIVGLSMAAETLTEAMVGQAQSLQMKELSNYNVFATKLPFQGEQIEYLLIAKNFFYHGVDSTLRKNQAVHVPFASTILAAAKRATLDHIESEKLWYLEKAQKAHKQSGDTGAKTWNDLVESQAGKAESAEKLFADVYGPMR